MSQDVACADVKFVDLSTAALTNTILAWLASEPVVQSKLRG
jgi:hypothetical protein